MQRFLIYMTTACTTDYFGQFRYPLRARTTTQGWSMVRRK